MDAINKYLQWAVVVSIFVMLFIIFIQVICRYIFHHSLVFSEELARYLFVYTVFLGSAVLMRENGHIVVEV
jgi:TRAP-type C4-dicarboxylate transport system permease small subunit